MDIFEKASYFDDKNKIDIKNNGVVFTDRKICDMIINKLEPKITDIICEPSVGKGIFIFSLLEYFKNNNHTIDELKKFIVENLYCYDINQDFIDDFKSLLLEYFNNEIDLSKSNIICGDFLLSNKTYDIIFGNPPYVRIQNLDEKYKISLRNQLKSMSMGNVDLYYAFIEKSLKHSKKIGFIIPNSFIKNKSGLFLREMLKDRLNYIYDFKVKRVWKNISSYTSIIICNEPTTSLVYEDINNKLSIDKIDLNDDKWIFNKVERSENNLEDLIYSYTGPVATLKDRVYKDIPNIEPNICKTYIKATKNERGVIIYPYENNEIIEEDILKQKYPLCYSYLVNNKELLTSRDNGKINKDGWYAYGRKQGLLKRSKGRRIILPLTFKRSKGIEYIELDNKDYIAISGIIVDIKEDRYEEFIKEINTDRFYDYCENNNRTLTDSNEDDIWLFITTKTIKNYTY